MLMPDSTWSISHVSGGGEPDRVYLAPPHDHTGSKALDGAESLVARRSFTSVNKGKTRTEVSQRLIHALDLYWLDEESAFCRLDEHGDIEPVLRVIDLEPYTGQSSDILVTIKARDLARYMVGTNTVLVQKFDFIHATSPSGRSSRSRALEAMAFPKATLPASPRSAGSAAG